MAQNATDHEMTDDNETVRPFAGLTRHNDEWTPDVWGHGSSMKWWAQERTGDDDDTTPPGRSFMEEMNRLPRCTTTEVGWKHPVTGEWVETEKHNALINPEKAEHVCTDFATRDDLDEAVEEGWLGDRAEKDDWHSGDEALYYVPTDDYTIINPSQFLGPLAEVVRDEELGDSVFGEFRLSRGGGRVSADVFFDGKHVEAPGMDADRKPIVVGVQIDWDFFGGTSVSAKGMAMDWDCVNALRAITDEMTVKHSGDVDERMDWHSEWESLLEQLDLKTDQLAQIIDAATRETLDVSDLPDDFAKDYDSVLEALYAYQGLPDYLAEHAANDLRATAADPFEPNWWEIHRGATYAVSHHARGDVGTGGAIEQYNRAANDMVMNPPVAEERMQENYVEARADDDGLEGEAGGTADIWLDEESIAEKKEQYQQAQDEIQQLIEADQ